MKRDQLLSESLNRHEKAEGRQLLSATGNDVVADSVEGNEVQVLTRGQMHATR